MSLTLTVALDSSAQKIMDKKKVSALVGYILDERKNLQEHQELMKKLGHRTFHN